MNKKSLNATEKIMAILIQLNILTNNRDENYFYDSLEMNVLLKLIDDLENNLDKVCNRIKSKYNRIDWCFVSKYRYEDQVFGKSIKLGDAWFIASNAYSILYKDFLDILNKELETYYQSEYLKISK